jgi:hypothetical protein
MNNFATEPQRSQRNKNIYNAKKESQVNKNIIYFLSI